MPNLGDMTKLYEKEEIKKPIDLLAGGTPCQSFSVAGLRGGLNDERGQLAMHFVRLCAVTRPKWVLWENVPGVLSSNGGRDFASFLGGLCGRHIEVPRTGWGNAGIIEGIENAYGLAYRVLDAKYFGVPQQRRRVFVVGHIAGSWQRACQVLFESGGVCWHPREGIAAGSQITALTTNGVGASGADDNAAAGHIIGALMSGRKSAGSATLQDAQNGLIILATGQANAEITKNVLPNLTCNHEQPIICFDEKLSLIGNKKTFNNNILGTLDTTQNKVVLCHDLQQVTSATNKSPDAEIPGSMTTKSRKIVLLNHPRRLTPIECERAMGFPDNYTKISEKTADAPRYRALGNSIVVPVLKWIGNRIEFIDNQKQQSC